MKHTPPDGLEKGEFQAKNDAERLRDMDEAAMKPRKEIAPHMFAFKRPKTEG